MTKQIDFTDAICLDIDQNWKRRELTEGEITIVKDMVRSYDNVTVTGVCVSQKSITVNLAVNRHSRAKYPNNHREYQETRSLEAVEWKGWF